MWKKLIHNKRILLSLLVLNFIGIILSFYTYLGDIEYYFNIGKFYVIPFFTVSFWLYLLAFLVVFYKYLGKKIPEILVGFAFVYCFVYGIGSFIFYPLFMVFVRGLTLYHTWNILAHGFVGLQSLLFLDLIKKPRRFNVFILIGIFTLKNLMDLLNDGFLYFAKFSFPYFFKIFLIYLIISLQIVAFCLLLGKRLK